MSGSEVGAGGAGRERAIRAVGKCDGELVHGVGDYRPARPLQEPIRLRLAAAVRARG